MHRKTFFPNWRFILQGIHTLPPSYLLLFGPVHQAGVQDQTVLLLHQLLEVHEVEVLLGIIKDDGMDEISLTVEVNLIIWILDATYVGLSTEQS